MNILMDSNETMMVTSGMKVDTSAQPYHTINIVSVIMIFTSLGRLKKS